MFHGILALVERSLRVDARSLESHLARFGLLAAVYASLCVALSQSTSFGAPGLRFFYGITYLNLIFMSLMGIGFFSTSISEEKEEHTLGLMLMAGISPLGILIGKSGGRLVQALLLIAVQYPFTLLSITMGGVSSAQVNAAYLGLTAYMVLLAGFGVLCSTIGSNNRAAGTRMIIGIAAYTLIPMLVARLLVGMGTARIQFPVLTKLLGATIQLSVFQQTGTILTTGFGDPAFSWQVISNMCVGVGCFGLSWALFGFYARHPESESDSRGLISLGRGVFRLFSPGRPWQNPFIWKDFHFVAGGVSSVPIRLALCFGLWHVVASLNGPNHIVAAYQAYLSLAIAIDAGRILARSVRAEIRGQTLNALVMLPRSTTAVIYSKFAGALLGWSPAALVDLLFSISSDEARRNFWAVLTDDIGICITSFFILIPNLIAALAVFLRWGSVPLGTGIVIGLFFGMMTTIRPGEPVGLYMIAFGILTICLLCHLTIVLRISSLTEK